MAGRRSRRQRSRNASTAGLVGLRYECDRCKTRASLSLDAIRRPRDTPYENLKRRLPIVPNAATLSASAHDQAHEGAGDRAYVWLHHDR
jgi:hypothetical protein